MSSITLASYGSGSVSETAPDLLRDRGDSANDAATDIDGPSSGDSSLALSCRDSSLDPAPSSSNMPYAPSTSVDATGPLAPVPPVARLPSELLVLIFRYCVDLENKYIRGPHAFPLRCDWRRLMLVCGHWWRTVKNAFELWTDIAWALHSKEETERAMARSSEKRLLSIDARFHNEQGPLMESGHVPNLCFVLENAPLARIEELAIAVDFQGFCLIHRLLRTDATSLKSFSFTFGDPQSIPPQNVALPTSIFAGKAPRLQRLALRNVRLNWSSSLIRDHLHLQYLKLSDVTLPSDVHVFWNALSCMPNLINLALGPFIASASAPRPTTLHGPQERPLIFARMAHLVIHAPDYICAWLWSNIIIPPTGTIKIFTLIKTKHRSWSPEDMCEAALRRIFLNSDGDMKIHALFELAIFPPAGPLSMATELLDIIRLSARCEMGQRVDLTFLFPDISLDAGEQGPLRTRVMHAIFQALSPWAAEDMRLNDQPRSPMCESEQVHLLKTWTCLDSFNRLKTLHIAGQAAYGFVETIFQHELENRHRDATETVGPNRVILPNLEVLRFEGIEFARKVDDPWGRRRIHQGPSCDHEPHKCPVTQCRTFGQVLLQALQDRTKTAPKLEELWFSDCRSAPRREKLEDLYRNSGIPQVRKESPCTFQWNMEEKMADTRFWELTDPDFDMYMKY